MCLLCCGFEPVVKVHSERKPAADFSWTIISDLEQVVCYMHNITDRIDTIVVAFVTSVAEQQDRIGRIGHVVEHCIER